MDKLERMGGPRVVIMKCGTMNGARERVTREPLTQEIVAPMPHHSSTPERFFAKVDFTDTCWLWTRCRAQGYGRFRLDKSVTYVYAHRYAYEFCVGSIPDSLPLDHLCCVRHCLNPDHLEPVTTAENNRRSRVSLYAK